MRRRLWDAAAAAATIRNGRGRWDRWSTTMAGPPDTVRVFLDSVAKARSSTMTAQEPAPGLDSKGVFVNNDTALSYIDVYGFDYDYTLANYKNSLESRIYDLGIKSLVNDHGYPTEYLQKKFDHDFAIRGLHFDRQTGFLLKIDQFGEFQKDTILLGRDPVSAKTVANQYKGRRMALDQESHLKMMTDMFSMPEACLLADVVQDFRNRGLPFEPLYIFQDVWGALDTLHKNGTIHQSVIDNPSEFLSQSVATKEYLEALKSAGKKLFLLSNSPWNFVNAGMKFIYGESWNELFDVIIVSAGKPSWFKRDSKFRRVEPSGRLSLSAVTELHPNEIYTQGSLSEFNRLTGWAGDHVIYFGDQIYSDLVEPQRLGAWKTAAVIKELEREVELIKTPEYMRNVRRLVTVEQQINDGQALDHPDVQKVLEELKRERNEIRHELKQTLNKYFGSTFRTYNMRTRFFYNVARYADVYTSRVSNMMKYPLNATFYARRSFFPHEPVLPSKL